MSALIFGILDSIASGLSAVLKWLFNPERIAEKKEEQKKAEVDAISAEVEAAAKGDEQAAANCEKRINDWLRK